MDWQDTTAARYMLGEKALLHQEKFSLPLSRELRHETHNKKMCLGKREENSVNRSCSCPLQDSSIMETSNNILNDTGGHTLGLSGSACLLFSKLTNKGQNDNRSTSLISKSTIVTNRENVRLAEHGFDKQQIQSVEELISEFLSQPINGSYRCPQCVKCTNCAPISKMAKQAKLTHIKQSENDQMRQNISIINDPDTNLE